MENQCKHGYIGFCPYGCQERDDEVVQMIQAVMQNRPVTIEDYRRILHYKQAEARQMTFELSVVLEEVAKIEEKIEELRRKR